MGHQCPEEELDPKIVPGSRADRGAALPRLRLPRVPQLRVREVFVEPAGPARQRQVRRVPHG